MGRFFFYAGKTMQVVGMATMPLALITGFTVEGSTGTWLELGFMAGGIIVFGLGRALEGFGASR